MNPKDPDKARWSRVELRWDDPESVKAFLQRHPRNVRELLDMLSGGSEEEVKMVWDQIKRFAINAPQEAFTIVPSEDKQRIAEEIAVRCSLVEREIRSKSCLPEHMISMFQAGALWMADRDFHQVAIQAPNGLLWRVSKLQFIPQSKTLTRLVYEIFTVMMNHCGLLKNHLGESLQVLVDSGGLQLVFTALTLHPEARSILERADSIFKTLIVADSNVLRNSFKVGMPCRCALEAAVTSTTNFETANKLLRRLLSIVVALRPADSQPTAVCFTSECGGCGLRAMKGLSACSRCKATFYCSRECQKQDWKNHKTKCSTYKKFREMGPPSDSYSWKAHQTVIFCFIRERYFSFVQKMRELRTRIPFLDVQDMVIWVNLSSGGYGVEPISVAQFKLPAECSVVENSEEELARWRTNILSVRDQLRPGAILYMEKVQKGLTLQDPEFSQHTIHGIKAFFTNEILDNPGMEKMFECDESE